MIIDNAKVSTARITAITVAPYSPDFPIDFLAEDGWRFTVVGWNRGTVFAAARGLATLEFPLYMVHHIKWED